MLYIDRGSREVIFTTDDRSWAMGGENQDFADMQAVDMRDLK